MAIYGYLFEYLKGFFSDVRKLYSFSIFMPSMCVLCNAFRTELSLI